jgi:hypothetical protein
MQRHAGLLEFLTDQELMGQLAGQPVQVMHNNCPDQALLRHIPDDPELRPIQAGAGVVVLKDVRLWYGIAVLLGQVPTGIYLGGQGEAFVGLIRGGDPGIDGGQCLSADGSMWGLF